MRDRGGAGSSAHAPAGTAHQLAPRPCRQATQCDATGQANPTNSAQRFRPAIKGGESQGLLRLQRPRRGCPGADGRGTRRAATSHTSCGAAVHASWIHRDRKRKPASRGTGWLSGGGSSARGACVAAGCAEREPARDPSRVRRGAVCADAGAHSPDVPERSLENGCRLLSVCSNGGGIFSGIFLELTIATPFL